MLRDSAHCVISSKRGVTEFYEDLIDPLRMGVFWMRMTSSIVDDLIRGWHECYV